MKRLQTWTWVSTCQVASNGPYTYKTPHRGTGDQQTTGSSGYWWWIGYHDRNAQWWEEPGSGWTWVDGSSSGYTNWNSGQPDDYWGNEDCGHMYGSSGQWNDLDCSRDNWYGDYLYYVCEEI